MSEYTRLVTAVYHLQDFYVQSLYADPGAFAYLNNRSYTNQTIQELGIGLDIGANKLLKSKGVDTLRDLEDTGIVLEIEPDDFVSIFHGRITFPILDLGGNTVGYTCRVWDSNNKSEAKYKNSPLSPLFQKSHVLYNLYHALPYILQQDYVIIVEGAADASKMWQYGIRNVVAPCGTSLMLHQVLILLNFTKNIITLFDNDTAGKKAAEKAMYMFGEYDISFNNLVLHDVPGKEKTDPDEYLMYWGVDNFNIQLTHLFQNEWKS